jgi:PAS domain S-box-containing protein
MFGAAALLSAILATYFGRRIAEPIRSLAALAGSPAGPFRPTRLAEVNEVAWALTGAARTLAERNREVADSQANYRSFVDLNPQIPWSAGPDGSAPEIGERFRTLTGISLEDARKGRWLCAVHPRDRRLVLAAWERAMKSGAALDVEHRLRMADGCYRWMRTRAYPRRGPDGRVERWYGATEDVDERRAARAAAAAGEALLSVGLGVAGIGLVEVDYRSDSVRLDPRAGEIFDLPADEALPRATLHQRLHPEDRPDLLARIAALLGPEGEGFLSAEYRIVRGDGSVRWLNGRHKVEYRPAAGPSRRAVRGVLAVQDVTERREGERRLAESYAEIEAIYDSAPIGLCVLGADLRFRRINDRLAEINGLPAEAHVGRHVVEVVPDIAAQAEAIARRVLETGEAAYDVEIAGETAAAPGVTRIWNENWRPLRNAAGRVYGISIVVEDVTRRRQDEQAIAAAAERFRATAEAVPGLMWVITADGRVSFVNKGFATFTGLPPGDLLERGWRSVVHPDDLAANLPLWREAVASGSPFEAQYRFRREDGAWRWHLTRTVPQRDASGRADHFVAIATDIDDLNRTRRALEETTADLERRVAEAIAERNEIWRLTPDFLGIGNLDGTWRDVNPAWTHVLGHSAGRILRMKPEDLIHPEDQERAAAMREALAEGVAAKGVE